MGGESPESSKTTFCLYGPEVGPKVGGRQHQELFAAKNSFPGSEPSNIRTPARIIWGKGSFQPKEHENMTKKSILALMVAAGGCLDIVAQADEIQFTTLPETVQTTVIRETHIASPTGVVRVIHDSTGVYAVTVRGTRGDQVVYVNETGTIVQAPATTTTTTVQTAQPVQPVQPAADTQQTVTTYDEVQKSQSRYELLEKKGNKEIYLDHQTGQKVTVKRAND
jgi:hypothetical protein